MIKLKEVGKSNAIHRAQKIVCNLIPSIYKGHSFVPYKYAWFHLLLDILQFL